MERAKQLREERKNTNYTNNYDQEKDYLNNDTQFKKPPTIQRPASGRPVQVSFVLTLQREDFGKPEVNQRSKLQVNSMNYVQEQPMNQKRTVGGGIGFQYEQRQPIKPDYNFTTDKAYSQYSGVKPAMSQQSSQRGLNYTNQNNPPNYFDRDVKQSIPQAQIQLKPKVVQQQPQDRREESKLLPKKPVVQRPPSAKQQALTNTISAPQDKRTTNQRPMSGVGTKPKPAPKNPNFEVREQPLPTQKTKQPFIPRALLEYQQQQQQNLIECKSCGRTFNDEAYPKHARICKKVFQQKRKVFNSQAKRLISNEQKKLMQIGQKKENVKPTQPQHQPLNAQPKWKNQSEQFRMAMRAARGVTTYPTGQTSGGGYGQVQQRGTAGNRYVQQPQPQQYDDRVPCPHCQRKFAEVAAQIHIPHCALQQKKAAIKGGGPVRSSNGFRR